MRASERRDLYIAHYRRHTKSAQYIPYPYLNTCLCFDASNEVSFEVMEKAITFIKQCL